MSPNLHGKWLVRGGAEYRADLEATIGRKLEDNDDRVTRKSGPPDPGIPQCTFCGSITPQDFVRFCEAGYGMELADWKYGFPHKVYIEVPNPNPNEMRESGGRFEGGVCVEKFYSTYPTLHLKFYTEHLKGFADLSTHAALINRCIGVWFEMREGRLHWRTGVPRA